MRHTAHNYDTNSEECLGAPFRPDVSGLCVVLKRIKMLLLLLLIKVSQHALAVVVEVYEGERSVLLPCLYSGLVPEDNPTVMWTRNDLHPKSVHLRGGGEDLRGQNQRYSGRTSMNVYALITKDFSLTLKAPKMSDSGSYVCSISAAGGELRLREIQLQVKESFPLWVTALLVLLVVLFVSVARLFRFQHYFMSDHQVEVDSGKESVQLPFKTTKNIPKDARVEWEDRNNRKVHVYVKNMDRTEEQHQAYRDRTEMRRILLKPGDLSLTLKYPTDRDTNTYTCTVYSREGNILLKKDVELTVRVPQVEVDSGVESVQLPCKATVHLPEDAEVEWTDREDRKVHVYVKNADQPDVQDQVYRERTKMNGDLLRTGDLSLTLRRPTDWDTKPYTCTVYTREGNILMKKQVELKVRVHQVEAKKGAESVQLPCRTTENLPEDAKVEWMDRYSRKVYVYQSGSDHPEEQEQIYKDRTEMNKDLLRTGDLSLTLKHPTDWDTNTYTCIVSSNVSTILEKQVELKVRVHQVEEMEGVEFVQLPFKTTENLPEDAKVEWMDRYSRKVHVYQSGSDQPEEQEQDYRGRTEMKMNKDLLETGDLSLILKRLKQSDRGTYRCCIWSKSNIIRSKTVKLEVKFLDPSLY